ncbi:MAG: hypothetical protein HF312_20555 [Ignavibacteria bacterium]|jgi:hypothetical protein|nr:hypothetical protein [Ignavibacteria bacterium]MCU7522617.1 hypothetical protein [Ignavibacteria bacterium]
MANSRTGILSSLIPVLIFTFIFYSCKSETPVAPPVQYGLKGKIVDSSGAAISDVKIRCTFYKNFLPAEADMHAGLSKLNDAKDYQFMLYQNFPNPVLFETFFRFSIPSEGDVTFRIMDRTKPDTFFSLTEKLSAGLYQIGIRNFGDSLKLKNGFYRYSVDFKSKTGATLSDSKELFLISATGNPYAVSDAEGNYFLDYYDIMAGDTLTVKPDENSHSEYILGNEVYLQLEKEGYYPTVIKTSLIKDALLKRDIVMRSIK